MAVKSLSVPSLVLAAAFFSSAALAGDGITPAPVVDGSIIYQQPTKVEVIEQLGGKSNYSECLDGTDPFVKEEDQNAGVDSFTLCDRLLPN